MQKEIFMMNQRNVFGMIALLGLLAWSLQAATPSPNFKVFLCFGQSNMSGGTQVGPDAESKKTNPRIKVLAFYTCGSPSRTTNQWYDACEPMHCGDGINSMGPSYAFGKMLADSLPNDTIGLIPAGLWGVSIEMFMKGGTNKSSSKPSMIGNNAWDWMVTKCQTAMKRGVFSGIILEQGESNSGDGAAWLNKVKTIYTDLKTTLPLTKDVPFVAGELLQASGNCCSGLNTTIDKIPQTLPLGYVASSKGLAAGGDQKQYHFDQAGYRTLGQRMAVEILKSLKVGAIQPAQHRVISAASAGSLKNSSKVYSLEGKLLASGINNGNIHSWKKTQPGNIYIVAQKGTGAGARLLMAQ